MRWLAAAIVLVGVPGLALAQGLTQPRQADQADARRQFCEFTLTEVDMLVSSMNAAFRGRQTAQRDVARLTGRPGADEARQRSERWGGMVEDLLTDLQKWTLVRAAIGCPAYGQ
jgi:hypothetical protein